MATKNMLSEIYQASGFPSNRQWWITEGHTPILSTNIIVSIAKPTSTTE